MLVPMPMVGVVVVQMMVETIHWQGPSKWLRVVHRHYAILSLMVSGLSLAFWFYFLIESFLGMPCDFLRNNLPSGTPPPPHMAASPEYDNVIHKSWDPFHNRTQFEIADFLYR